MTDETTLGELFRLDPRQYTKQHIETIVSRMRQARTQFNLGAKTATPSKKPSAKAVPSNLLEGLEI